MSQMIDFLAAPAFAAGGDASGGGSMLSLLPLIIIFVVFYFLLIRPQQKRAKQHKEMVAALKKGDEVATNGGTAGVIVKVGDNFIDLQIAEQVVIKVQRHAVAAMLPKGTLKSS